MLKLPKVSPAPSIYSVMPDRLRRNANPDDAWRKEVGDFIGEQFLMILANYVWSAEEVQAAERLHSDRASADDLALRPRLTAKLDALILRESEELGWSLIRNSGVIMQRVDSWDNMHGGAALFTEWGKRLAIATRIRHGQKRPRISDNLIEYKSKLKTVAELQRVAAKLRALDLDDRLPTRDAQVKAIISAIGSIIQRDSRKLSQLADPFNLKLWMDFFQANEDAVFELLAKSPRLSHLYDRWRAWYTRGVSPEKMRVLISLSGRTA